jgi:hypothetical protein
MCHFCLVLSPNLVVASHQTCKFFLALALHHLNFILNRVQLCLKFFDTQFDHLILSQLFHLTTKLIGSILRIQTTHFIFQVFFCSFHHANCLCVLFFDNFLSSILVNYKHTMLITSLLELLDEPLFSSLHFLKTLF